MDGAFSYLLFSCQKYPFSWVTADKVSICKGFQPVLYERYTFATLAIQSGVDVKTVSSILGHYSAGFTLDTYTHVTGDMQKEAAKRVGGLIAQAV